MTINFPFIMTSLFVFVMFCFKMYLIKSVLKCLIQSSNCGQLFLALGSSGVDRQTQPQSTEVPDWLVTLLPRLHAPSGEALRGFVQLWPFVCEFTLSASFCIRGRTLDAWKHRFHAWKHSFQNSPFPPVLWM